MLRILRKYSGNGKILEAGCGTGIITSQLASEGYNVTGIDINDKILQLCRNLEYEYFKSNKANYVNKSIFKLDYDRKSFDLCFSCGVLEHFEDKEIINSLKQQLNIAKIVIVVIPTKWFDDNEALHGDDRFLKLSYWRNLISSSGGKIIKEYSYPFKQKYYQKIKNIRKIFRPKAYRVFVIKEGEYNVKSVSNNKSRACI